VDGLATLRIKGSGALRLNELTKAVTLTLYLLCARSALEAQSLDRTLKGTQSLEEIVSKQTSHVKERFPQAKLFEVYVYNVVPQSFRAGEANDASVESSYYIGSSQSFVQAVQKHSSDPLGTGTVLLRKNSKQEDCKVGYPGPGAQVCSQQLGGLEHEPSPISVNVLDKLPVLLHSLSNHGIDGDRPVVLTFTTADRAIEVIVHSPENADILHRLGQMRSGQAVMWVAKMSGSDSIVLFNGESGEFLGKSVTRESHSPPISRH
jgi:hypothetical protein